MFDFPQEDILSYEDNTWWNISQMCSLINEEENAIFTDTKVNSLHEQDNFVKHWEKRKLGSVTWKIPSSSNTS